MSASARGFLRVLLVAALAVGLVGLFRLGRQFPAAAQSPGLLVPFLKSVLALTLEAASFVALSAALLDRLGRQAEAQAPLAARAIASLPALALMFAALVSAAVLPRGTEQPGLLANDLISRALAGCGGGTTSVPVPLLGLDVKCSSPPTIEGPMPGVGAVRVAMRELSFSEDLRRVRIAGLDLSAKRSLSVRLRAGTAEIKGLAPWTRPAQMSTAARLSLLAGLGALLWLAASTWWRPAFAEAEPASAAGSWLRRGLLRLRRALLLASPGVVMAMLIITFDQQRAGATVYGVAAGVGVALLLLLRLLAQRAPKLFGSFGNS